MHIIVNIKMNIQITIEINIQIILYNKITYEYSLAAPGALAHRLQRRTAWKIQNGRQWAPK